MRFCLYAAFLLSGASSLIYQTVWVRMLTRYLGSTTYALATVLGVFMAGLALGSYLAGRWVDRSRQPLRWYAILEVAIAGLALVVSFLVIAWSGPIYLQAYGWLVGDGEPGWTLLLARVGFVTLCLLPATVLMGATLPILVAHVSRQGQRFQDGLGQLYATNTLGAVLGVLAAGFVLLGVLGETGSLLVAAVANLLAGGLALASGRGAEADAEVERAEATASAEPYPAGLRRLALLTLFVSGFTALAYEVLWTRQLVLYLETSIYAFTAMLSTLLIGIAWGSWDAAKSESVRTRPLASVGMLEICIGTWAAVGMLAYPYFDSQTSPLWRSLADLIGKDPQSKASFGLAMLGCIFLVLPMAFFFGRQFPPAVRAAAADPDRPGQSTGTAYAINTVGTILGSLATGFVLIPTLGTALTMLTLAAVNVGLGLVLLACAPAAERGSSLRWGAGLAGVFVLAALLAGDPYRGVIEKRLAQWYRGAEIYHYFESPTGTTVAAGSPRHPTYRTLLVNGVGMTALVSETKVMAHLPYLLVDQPRRALVICFGMGTTFRSLSGYPDLQVDAVDIVPEVFGCFDSYHPDAAAVRQRPNAHWHADDGRNFLQVRDGFYDIITIDPPPPLHSAGAVNLYTRDFFTLCKSRLTPGGVLCLWLPPGPEGEMLMIIKTFREVFPGCSMWGGLSDPGYPGFYLTGGHKPFARTPAEVKMLSEQLSSIQDLGEWNKMYRQPGVLERMYLLDAAGIDRLVGNAAIISDDRPYTEFPLWRGVFQPEMFRELNADVIRQRSAGGHAP